MQYSPKLKTAMEEIKAVFAKYDIGGVAIIHTPGYSEYFQEISPSYSCVKPEFGNIRIKLKVSELGKEKATEIANGTANMVYSVEDLLVKRWKDWSVLKGIIDRHMKVTNLGTSESSHDQQNN